jgi:hypothetical protein
MRRSFVVALLATALVVGVLQAQEAPRPVTVASFFKILPGKGETVMGLFKKYDQPVLEKLMADGTIRSWGVARPWLHTQGDWNIVYWSTTADIAGQGKVDEAFEAAEKSRSADENKKSMESFVAAEVPDAHRDMLFRHVIYKMGKGPGDKAGKGYMWLGHYSARPGKGQDVTSFFTEVTGPVMDKLLADGVIAGYGLMVPVTHVAGGATHTVWYWVDSVGAFDKVQAALRTARESHSKEQTAALDARAEEIFQPNTHFDDVLEVSASAGH